MLIPSSLHFDPWKDQDNDVYMRSCIPEPEFDRSREPRRDGKRRRMMGRSGSCIEC